jgi:hypothetical protein
MIEKTVLLGLHGNSDRKNFADSFEPNGFRVIGVGSLLQMLKEMENNLFGWYVMDVNLSNSGSLDTSPSRRIYDLVRNRVERDDARFYAVSHMESVVEKAISEGIPARDKILLGMKIIGEEYDSI